MPATSIEQQGGSYMMPTLEHASVADAMHPGVLSCSADTTATEVARLMSGHHVHCVAVTGVAPDHAAGANGWALVTDFDLLEAGMRLGAEETAATLARRPVVVTEPSASLRDAIKLMLTHHAAHLLVVDPRREHPVGVLSTLDVAGVLAWGES